jgi:hypothetical protein
MTREEAEAQGVGNARCSVIEHGECNGYFTFSICM